MLELCSRQPQAGPSHVFGHPGHSGEMPPCIQLCLTVTLTTPRCSYLYKHHMATASCPCCSYLPILNSGFMHVCIVLPSTAIQDDGQITCLVVLCGCSCCLLSLFVLQEQYGFAAKMRNQAVEQLKALETWVERQATGLDMAANPESLRQSFDKLLKVWSPQVTPAAPHGGACRMPVGIVSTVCHFEACCARS